MWSYIAYSDGWWISQTEHLSKHLLPPVPGTEHLDAAVCKTDALPRRYSHGPIGSCLVLRLSIDLPNLVCTVLIGCDSPGGYLGMESINT